jgi:HupF/HypC family protein
MSDHRPFDAAQGRPPASDDRLLVNRALPDKQTSRQGDAAHVDRSVSLSPGLVVAPMVVGPSCAPDTSEHCITCGDQALPATVLRLGSAADMALVAVDDTTIEVDISLVDPLTAGDRVLVHGGVAIAKL